MYMTKGVAGLVDNLYKNTDGILWGFSYNTANKRIDDLSRDDFTEILRKFFSDRDVYIFTEHTYGNRTFESIAKDLDISKAYVSKLFIDAVNKIRGNEAIFETIMYGKDFKPNNTTKTTVTLLGVSPKTLSGLHKAGVYYIEDLTSLTAINKLLGTKAFGVGCLHDLLICLDKFGYKISK